MASQRRAPTKRPPRPAAKKPPPPPSTTEGTDAAERVSKSAKPGAAPTAKSGGGGDKVATKVGSAPAPAAKSGSAPAAKANGAAKGAPSTGVTKTNAGGGNYRPPTGASRNRRPLPPPRRKRPQITKKAVGVVVALGLIGTLVVFFSLAVNGSSGGGVTNAALGPEKVAIGGGTPLASVDAARYPQTIDGIQCQTNEQVAYHIHAHLSLFVDGQARQVPYAIGIAPPVQFATGTGTFVNGGSCFYWLHTHAADGIMHVESPTTKTYTLGDFFDVWGQPLKAGQVGPAVGQLTMYVNGKLYKGDPRAISLAAHADIQLDVGAPAPAPVVTDWSLTQL